MRRLILCLLFVLLAVPVSGQIDFSHTATSDLALAAVDDDRHLHKLAGYLMDVASENCVEIWHEHSNFDHEAAATVCVFEDRYFDRPFVYMATAEWSSMRFALVLIRDGEVIDFVSSDGDGRPRIATPAVAGEYEAAVFGYNYRSGTWERSVQFTIESSVLEQS